MGAACVRELADRGHAVLAVARRGDVLRDLFGADEQVSTVEADLGDDGCWDDLLAAIDAAASAAPIRSLVHGAATAVDLEAWTDIDAHRLTEHFRVHVAAAMRLTSELGRHGDLERCIIFDSYSASTPRHGWSAYSILKAAAQMAFRAAREELPGTAVARVYPGAVATPLLDRVLDADRSIEATAVYHELNERGRVSTPAEIATAVVDLLELDLDAFAADEVWHVGHPADLD